MKPVSICLSPDGQLLYVVKRGDIDRIEVLRVSDGSLVQTIPKHNIKDGYAIACISPSNEIFIVDFFNHCIKVLDAVDGSIIRTIGGPDQLQIPIAACLSGDSLYIADSDNSRIQVFRVDGTYVQSIGEGRLDNPVDVCISPDGELFVAESERNHIKVFGKDGSYIRSITSGGDVITLSPNGEFLFVSQNFGKIKMVRVGDGTLVREIGNRNFDIISGIRVSRDGQELFVSDYHVIPPQPLRQQNVIQVFQL